MTPWTEQERQLIRQHYPTTGTAILSELLPHRKKNDIRKVANKLGLLCAPQKRKRLLSIWTPEQDATLRKNYPLIRRRKTASMDLTRLCTLLGMTRNQVTYRATQLGLCLPHYQTASPHWTAEEEEFIAENAHLSVKHLAAQMRQRGWIRSASAIAVKRGRLGITVCYSTNAYSAKELGWLLGKASYTITQWIARGWLAATPRTDAIDSHHGGVGDRWLITPQAVLDFIFTYRAYIDLTTVDKDWFLSLLENGAPKKKTLIQDRCGKEGTMDFRLPDVA